LFYIETRASENGRSFINTVADNSAKFTSRELIAAKLARKIQNTIGHPSTTTYINIINKTLLKDCPVTEQDVRNAELIFGPNLGSIKGKTGRSSSTPVLGEYHALPSSILTTYKNVTLCVDIMFINQIIFLITLSRKLNFGTVEVLQNRKATTILSAIKSVRYMYNKRGLTIELGLMDNEFEPLRVELMRIGIQLNVTANDEHVPEVERYIRTIKERVRCVYNSLPYRQIPARMLIEMVHASVFWLNNFPPKHGISDTMSPRYIMTGFHIQYNKHCNLEFGAYAQVHEDHDSTMATRTTGAIALRPTGNQQGGFYFMSLNTGRRLNRNHWTELPMPSDVIDRVHLWARRGKASKNLLFMDRHGIIIPDDDDESQDTVPDDDNLDPIGHGIDQIVHNDVMIRDDQVIAAADDAQPVDAAQDHAHISDDDATTVGGGHESDDEDLVDIAAPDIGDTDMINDTIVDNNVVDDIEGDELEDNTESTDGSNIDVMADAGQDDIDIGLDDIDAVMDDTYGARTGAYHLRPRKPRDYGHIHTTLEHTCMTQYSVKKGLKEFGAAGTDAVVAEMRQLDERGVIEPKSPQMLTASEKHRSLQYLMFLKKKRCGRIKGRGCADGRK
jgi:hypothetical protein